MTAFGFSPGDIVVAIKIIWQIIEAFGTAKGAKKQYEASHAFLRALVPVLQRIHDYLENPEHDQSGEEMAAQGVIIWKAYSDFEAHLEKRHGLSLRRSDPRSMVDTLRWSLDDISDRVQKLKSKVVDAMAFIGPLLAFEIRAKVDEMAKNLEHGNQSRDVLLHEFNQLLEMIRDQSQCLEQLSAEYKCQLADGIGEIKDNRNAEMKSLKGNVESIEDKQARLAESQAQLADSLKMLTEQIAEQRQHTTSQAEADNWAKLQDDANEQTDSISDLQGKTSQGLSGAAQTLQGFEGLGVGNGRLGVVSNKVTGASNTFDGLGRLGALMGSRSRKDNQPSSNTRPPMRPTRSLPRPPMRPTRDVRIRSAAEAVRNNEFKRPAVRAPPMRYTLGQESTDFEPARQDIEIPPRLPPRSKSDQSFQRIGTAILNPCTKECPPQLPPRPPKQPSVRPKPDAMRSQPCQTDRNAHSPPRPSLPLQERRPTSLSIQPAYKQPQLGLQRTSEDRSLSHPQESPLSTTTSVASEGLSSRRTSVASSSPATSLASVRSLSPVGKAPLRTDSEATLVERPGEPEQLSFSERRRLIATSFGK